MYAVINDLVEGKIQERKERTAEMMLFNTGDEILCTGGGTGFKSKPKFIYISLETYHVKFVVMNLK